MLNNPSIRRIPLLSLLLATLLIYLSSLNFGFFWDDPRWYGHVLGKSWLDLVKPTPEFHFYRPFSLLYNLVFIRADGTYPPTLLHWLQICCHLLNIALAFAISRRLILNYWASLTAASLIAVFPFSYQAVSWAAPGQPWAALFQNGAWLAYLIARSNKSIGGNLSQPFSYLLAYVLSLSLFVMALITQESSVALSITPFLLELIVRKELRNWRAFISSLKSPVRNRWLLVLAYPILAGIYFLVWIQAPRYPGVTGIELESLVASYLFQGFIYPILGRPLGYPSESLPGPLLVNAIFITTLVILLGVAVRRNRGRFAVIGFLWALFAISPSLIGLNFGYASLAPRLLYGSAMGVILLWLSALWPTSNPRNYLIRFGGVLLLILIIAQSVALLLNFERLYRAGVEHMDEALQVMDDADDDYLFINFPDRFAAKRPPYPLGYWGLTLAPITMELGDFPSIVTGQKPQTLSHSLPWIDTDTREVGPYWVDMRGTVTQADELYRLAASHDEIYLSRYFVDGSFSLQLAGSLKKPTNASCQLALYKEVVCLHLVQVKETEGGIQVDLRWSTREMLPPHITIFVHLNQPGSLPVAQADGDTWRDMLPLTMWQPGDIIHEQRMIDYPATKDNLVLQIGLYDRLTGERLAATTPDGRSLEANAFVQQLTQ